MLCESINTPPLRNCPSRLRRPCSSSTSPFCLRVAGRGRDVVETAKSVLSLEETARQLLFLHSSKSSLESNLPVCYCIQTTPQPTSSVTPLRPPPRPRLFYGCWRSVYSLSPSTHTHTHTSTRLRIYVRTHCEIHEAVREPFLLVSSFYLAPERTNFACTRVALLFGNLTYVCLLAYSLACGALIRPKSFRDKPLPTWTSFTISFASS